MTVVVVAACTLPWVVVFLHLKVEEDHTPGAATVADTTLPTSAAVEEVEDIVEEVEDTVEEVEDTVEEVETVVLVEEDGLQL